MRYTAYIERNIKTIYLRNITNYYNFFFFYVVCAISYLLLSLNSAILKYKW